LPPKHVTDRVRGVAPINERRASPSSLARPMLRNRRRAKRRNLIRTQPHTFWRDLSLGLFDVFSSEDGSDGKSGCLQDRAVVDGREAMLTGKVSIVSPSQRGQAGREAQRQRGASLGAVTIIGANANAASPFRNCRRLLIIASERLPFHRLHRIITSSSR